jgi:hypothetical protein
MTGNRQHRRQGIRQHMQIGRSQIMVVTMAVRIVIMVVVIVIAVRRVVVVVVVVVAIAENPDADGVDKQPHHGHEDGLVEGNRHRLKQAMQAFARHHGREQQQQQRAGESAQRVDFAGAEGQAGIMGVAPRKVVREGIDGEGGRMRGHVQAIRQQGHRAKQNSGRNFRHHHQGGQRDHDARAPLRLPHPILPEAMPVRRSPRNLRARNHRRPLRPTADRYSATSSPPITDRPGCSTPKYSA